MRNIKLVIQYDGTNYHGWQIQSRPDTIQGRLIDALRTMLNNQPVKLSGASRTDAGVHALGQIANFQIPENVSLSCSAFYHGLNSLTPRDIIITDVQEVPLNFHARFDARGKTYCYQIINAQSSSIYHLRFSWHIRQKLDVAAMREASRFLLGCHDFKAFQSSSCGAPSSVRTIFAVHVWHRKSMIRVFLKADAYLHHMVRIIIGTLVDVGTKRISPERFREILQSKDRTKAGVTAPAQGLLLVKVHYENIF